MSLEFSHLSIEALRQPLEDGSIHLSRSLGSATFPAKFILIAATNPCPCGYNLSSKKQCVCSSHVVRQYLKKLSGPIYDRFDLHVAVKEIEVEKLISQHSSVLLNSHFYRDQVEKARKKQRARYQNQPFTLNSELPSKLTKQYLHFSSAALMALSQSTKRFDLSGRSYFKLMKISQTIADLDTNNNENRIDQNHVLEALQYR